MLFRSDADKTVELVNKSGGEAQKIAIARALYKKAPFIILDEPTSALDPMAEYEIYSSFDRLIQDRMAVYISHNVKLSFLPTDYCVKRRTGAGAGNARRIDRKRRNLRYDVECTGTKLSIEGDWTYEKQFSKDDVRLFCRLYRSGDRQ